MGISMTHLIILLVVVILIFGTTKIANLGKDLGKAVKGFKDGVKDSNQDAAETQKTVEQAKVIDVVAKEAETQSSSQSNPPRS
jgi:sec-independent protein translocase protein TatA